MLWTHLPNRDDMFAVFDQLRRKNPDGSIVEKKVMKLVRAGELLEQIELDDLEHQVRLDEERAQSQVIGDDNLRVLVIVKKPLLALRYQLVDGNIRRIQMNFQPASGCDIALNVFNSIALPIRDRDRAAQAQALMQQPRSSQDAHSSLQPLSQEGTKDFITAYGQVEQLVSAVKPASSQFRSMQPLGAWNNAACDSIPPPSAQPNQMPTSRSAFVRDGMTENEFSKSITYIQDPKSRLDKVEGVVDAHNSLTSRPSPSSATYEARSHSLAIPPRLLPSVTFDSQRSVFNFHEDRPTSAPETQSARFLDSLPISQILPPKRELPFPNKVEKPLSQNLPAWTGTAQGYITIKAPELRVTELKAKSAKKAVSDSGKGMHTHTRSESDDRVLKFSCPDCGRKDLKSAMGLLLHCNSQHNRHFTSTDAAIEASIQAFAVDTTGSVGSKPPTVRKTRKQTQVPSSSAPKPRARKAASKKRALDTPPPSSAPSRIDTSRRRLGKAVSPIDDAFANTPKPNMSRREVSTGPFQKSDTNKRPSQGSNVNAQFAGKEQQVRAGPSISNISPAEYLDALDGWIKQYHNILPPKPPQTAKDQLAEYAKQSDEDRAKAIDDMICDCLEDENFIKLVEDVEGAWRRIGLGF